MTTNTIAPAPDAAPPIGTPPGGGRWTWDAAAGAWRQLPDTPPTDADAPAQE